MAKKVAVVFVLAVTGVIGTHAFYTQAGTTTQAGKATEASYRGDRPNQVALALSSPEVAREPVPTLPSTNASPQTFDAEPTASRSTPAGGGSENFAPPPTEQQPSKAAEKPPAPKKKVVRRQLNGLDGAYAQYTYRDHSAQWAWHSQRPSTSRFFPF